MSLAISGLLKCQGSFRNPGGRNELRCCLPAELYYRFSELSSNPNKDFQNKIILHWRSEELIKLSAYRYSQYLKLYHPNRYESLRELNLHSREGAIEFWSTILPSTINNRIGVIEDPIAYLLRHTQLLPRHILMLLNNISIKNRRYGGNPIHFSEEAVMEGIYETEYTICDEIINAYEYVHPEAREICEKCLRYLPLRFDEGLLHRIYNRHGRTITGIYDYEDFKRVLIEIGVLGRVTKQTDRYVEGIFEYVIPHKLIVSSNDQLCVHPVFCEVFSSIMPDEKNGERLYAIYPYGTGRYAKNNFRS